MALTECSQLEHEILKPNTSPKHTWTCLQHSLSASTNMILHISYSRNFGGYWSSQHDDPIRYNQGSRQGLSQKSYVLQRYKSCSLNRFPDSSLKYFDWLSSPSWFPFRYRGQYWNNEYPRTSPSLHKLSWIRCVSSQHAFLDHICTTSLVLIRTSLISRYFPLHHA